MDHRANFDGTTNQQQYDDFEDFGLKVQNIGRLHKNRLPKFKDHIGWRYDSL